MSYGASSLKSKLFSFYSLTPLLHKVMSNFHNRQPLGDFIWRGNWRSTVLRIPQSAQSTISCRGLCSDVIYRPFYCSHVPITRFLKNIPSRNAIPRLSNLTESDFSSKWANAPFILTDQVPKWPISKTWNTDYLLQHFPGVKFRAESLDWTLEKYVTYMRNTQDESPLYLFDRSFVSNLKLSSNPGSSADFWTPYCFGEDFFSHLSTDRPDSTWLILGPGRSGSTLHVDPNGTSAWNAVLQGSKYWLMFPPPDQGHDYPPGVIVSKDASEITAPVSIPEYLLSFHEMARNVPGVKEGICRAGEMIYVPAGWFHLVWNLDEGLAVTGNFVHKSRLPDVLMFMSNKRDQVSGFADEIDDAYALFVERLKEKCPDAFKEALQELQSRQTKRELASKGTKRKWEEVKKVEDGGFSFGFRGDDDDFDDE
jgi:Cupin-like domain